MELVKTIFRIPCRSAKAHTFSAPRIFVSKYAGSGKAEDDKVFGAFSGQKGKLITGIVQQDVKDTSNVHVPRPS